MKSISWLLLLLCLFVFFKESKEDRQRHLDPKLLFPLKAWLQGFLPGHQFSWEEEDAKCLYDLEVVKRVNLTKCSEIVYHVYPPPPKKSLATVNDSIF